MIYNASICIVHRETKREREREKCFAPTHICTHPLTKSTHDTPACQKERIARCNQDEREKHLQAAMLETEQRRRDLDSRLWLLEERRKQDLTEFAQLREDYAGV